MDSNFSSFININVFSSYNIIIFLHLHHKNIHPEYRCLNFWQNLHASGGGARREAMNESPRSFAKVCWALGANTRLIALRSYGMMKFGVVDNEVCKVSRCLGRRKLISAWTQPRQNSRVWVVLVNGYFFSTRTHTGGLRSYDSEGQGKASWWIFSRSNILIQGFLQSSGHSAIRLVSQWRQDYYSTLTQHRSIRFWIFVYWNLLFLNPIQSWKLTVLTPNTISQ